MGVHGREPGVQRAGVGRVTLFWREAFMDEVKPVRRQRFEVKSHIDPVTGLLRKDVFVDDKLFGWEVDGKSWANLMSMGKDAGEIAKVEILRHFCESLSNFVGRKVGPGEIMKAIQTGWL